MNILIFTWKDRKNPLAGGAEVVNEELARRLVADGHKVTLLVGGFAKGKHKETINGYQVIRVGGRVTVYWQAFRYYQKHLKGWADLVIEEVNTVPFFTRLYVKEKSMLFFHQLARRIWFYEIFVPLNFIGFAAEPLYLKFLRKTGKAIVVSDSTKQDLLRYRFDEAEILLISEGIDMKPVPHLNIKKYETPTLLSLGTVRPMKRTLDQVKAFEIARQAIPGLQLKIAGQLEGKYGHQLWRRIMESPFANDIDYLGKVSDEQKYELLRKSHVVLQTSVKEGWGLTITEAASQGTPAVAYDVDGLRDSIRDGQSGVITDETPSSLAAGIVKILRNEASYEAMRRTAWQWSKEITFERCYQDFRQVMEEA